MEKPPLVKNLEDLMARNGIDAKNLSKKAGLGETAVRDILVGRSLNPTVRSLSKIAQALECTLPELTGEASPAAYAGLSDTIPVYSLLAPNALKVSVTDASEQMQRPPQAPSVGAFALAVVGDHMEPMMEEGMRVIADPKKPLVKNRPCVVEYADGTAEVKLFIKRSEEGATFGHLKPREEITVLAHNIKAIHRVVSQEF